MVRKTVPFIRMWGTFHWLSAYIHNMFIECQEWAQGLTFKDKIATWERALPPQSLYSLTKSAPGPLCSYSLFQKKRTFNSDFFPGPAGGGGPKIHMVDYVNGSSTNTQFFFVKKSATILKIYIQNGSRFSNEQNWAHVELPFT